MSSVVEVSAEFWDFKFHVLERKREELRFRLGHVEGKARPSYGEEERKMFGEDIGHKEMEAAAVAFDSVFISLYNYLTL